MAAVDMDLLALLEKSMDEDEDDRSAGVVNRGVWGDR